MPRGISFAKLEAMKHKIEDLSEESHKMILKIIHDDNVLFSENANGVFFDIAALDVETVKKIQSYLDFCDKSDKYLKECSQTEKEILRTIPQKSE